MRKRSNFGTADTAYLLSALSNKWSLSRTGYFIALELMSLLASSICYFFCIHLYLLSSPVTNLLFVYFSMFYDRKVKEAWENKRDVLVKSGAFAIEQLSEALSASAKSNSLPVGLPQKALELCAEQVRLITSGEMLYLSLFICFKLHGVHTGQIDGCLAQVLLVVLFWTMAYFVNGFSVLTSLVLIIDLEKLIFITLAF